MGITARTPRSETLLEEADGARRVPRLDAGARTAIPTRRTWTRIALAAGAATLALLAAGTPGAAAAPAATATATGDCWLAVVNDWLDNNRVDGVYAIPCYTQAIQHLNAYPDVQNYSSATDDIQRALLAAIRQDRGNGPGAGSGPLPGNGNGTPPGPGSNNPTPTTHGVLGSWTPTDAQSIPLPLIVLAALALLLLAAAAATWFARRVQARRLAPAPAQTTAIDKRG